MGIQIMDVIGERRLLMVILSNGQHVFVVGRSVERAARLVSEQIEDWIRVIAIFDGFNMYTAVEWKDD